MFLSVKAVSTLFLLFPSFSLFMKKKGGEGLYTHAHNFCVENSTKQRPILLDSKSRSKFKLKFELYSLFLINLVASHSSLFYFTKHSPKFFDRRREIEQHPESCYFIKF